MHEINLEDGKINHEGKWLSADDLTNMIQEKMKAGDMKFANLATVLEELNKALENSHTLEIKLVLTKDEHKKLSELGGKDDRESVRKAVMAFIGGPRREKPAPSPEKPVPSPEKPVPSPEKPAPSPKKPPSPEKKKVVAINCPKCKSPLEVSGDDRPVQVECQKCGTEGIITADNKWIRHE